MSRSAKRRCTPEWREAKSKSMRTKLPLKKVKQLYASGLTQEEVGEKLGVSQKVIWKFMGRNGLTARIAAKRDQWGEKNHKWKGPNASYKAMHLRMTKRFGQPKRCETCGTTDKRRSYDWANLTGRYDDTTDYRRLCRSCHCKLDNRIKNLRGGA